MTYSILSTGFIERVVDFAWGVADTLEKHGHCRTPGVLAVGPDHTLTLVGALNVTDEYMLLEADGDPDILDDRTLDQHVDWYGEYSNEARILLNLLYEYSISQGTDLRGLSLDTPTKDLASLLRDSIGSLLASCEVEMGTGAVRII